MPLISAAELLRELDSDGPPALLDVRWELASGAQHDAYLGGHIPGAAFVDLERDLAAPPGPEGRHPLPTAGAFAAAMGRAGVSAEHPVVLYDARDGLAAARAWWLLRYFGHRTVRLLDGGLAAWLGAGGGLETGDEPARRPGAFIPTPGQMPRLAAAGAAALPHDGVLLDSRAPERFRGEREPIDPVAGHIPGARNHPTTVNLAADGRFRSPGELRATFARSGAAPATRVGAYCGSGVTAAHQVLALEVAGIRAALYPGSWSEWITDPRRPVAIGDDAF